MPAGMFAALGVALTLFGVCVHVIAHNEFFSLVAYGTGALAGFTVCLAMGDRQ
jgi:hypothetical protein